MHGRSPVVKGWAPDGREVELTQRQEAEVRALVSISGPVLPRDEDWSTVLHTAVRYDGLRRGVPLDDPAYEALTGKATT